MLGSGSPFNPASSEVTRLIVQLKRELSKSETPVYSASPRKLIPKNAPPKGKDEWETF